MSCPPRSPDLISFLIMQRTKCTPRKRWIR